jgi:hypothetical protein
MDVGMTGVKFGFKSEFWIALPDALLQMGKMLS